MNILDFKSANLCTICGFLFALTFRFCISHKYVIGIDLQFPVCLFIVVCQKAIAAQVLTMREKIQAVLSDEQARLSSINSGVDTVSEPLRSDGGE